MASTKGSIVSLEAEVQCGPEPDTHYSDSRVHTQTQYDINANISLQKQRGGSDVRFNC